MPSMEPLPETVQAVDELDPAADGGVLRSLLRLATEAGDQVPTLVAVSLTRIKEDLTFTLLATADEGSVGEHATEAVEAPSDPGDALDEAQWRAGAEEPSFPRIRSTLTLPIIADHEVVQTVTLYAASEAAFRGHHDRLAALFGAWAGGAVTNADLSFSSREEARDAPRRVRDRNVVDVAIGILAAQLGVALAEAEKRLQDAAARAGLKPVELARRIVHSR